MRGFDGRRRLTMVALMLAVCGRLFLSAVFAEPSAARRLSAIEVVIDGRGLVVSLAGDGRLKAPAIGGAEHWPPRLVVDLPEVISGVPGPTWIGAGPVENIRIATHSLNPLITRVVFELRRSTTYEITEPEEGNGRMLTFVFPLDPARPAGARRSGRGRTGDSACGPFASERPARTCRVAAGVQRVGPEVGGSTPRRAGGCAECQSEYPSWPDAITRAVGRTLSLRTNSAANRTGAACCLDGHDCA